VLKPPPFAALTIAVIALGEQRRALHPQRSRFLVRCGRADDRWLSEGETNEQNRGREDNPTCTQHEICPAYAA
jgi:hypothetical protein